MFREVKLESVSRSFALPFPVAALGVFADDTCGMRRHVPEGRLEFCLRLTSEAEWAFDRIDGVEYRTRFPHLILKRPGIAHDYAVPERRSALFFSYHADLEAPLRRAGLMPSMPCREIVADPAFDALLRELERLMTHALESGVSDRIDLLCLQLLELLVLQERRGGGGDEQLERIRRVASYLQLHFADEVDFDRIAASVGMSRSTFFRHWKLLFAVTPAQYLLELRMNEAARLLRATNRSVAAIAGMVQYCDSACFCAAFKRHFELTPQQFRKKEEIFF